MSRTPDRKKHKPVSSKQSSGVLDSSMVIRLVLASLVFAVTLIVNMPEFLRIILLVISAVTAGYDIVIKAAERIEEGDYFSAPVVVIIISALSYFVGFSVEGAALLILYQIGLLLIAYAEDRTRKSAMELLKNCDADVVSKLDKASKSKETTATYIEGTMRSSSGAVLKMAMIFAVIYAIALPQFTNLSYSISIHRALTIILVATPMSVVASIPLSAFVGMCYSAQQGVVFESAAPLEDLAEARIAVFDKAGIFSEECPKILSMYSDVLDSNTFMNFVAHSVYYSDQPIAKAISAVSDVDYQLDLVSDFRDIPGYGVMLLIDGIKVVFATRDFLSARGVALPNDKPPKSGTAYYMIVANRYIGKVVISSEVNSNMEALIPDMRSVGFQRCVLVTEDSKQSSLQLAELMGFSEMYAECGDGQKLLIVKEIAKKAKCAVLYVYSNGIGAHSAATVDMRVSKRGKYCDALVDPQSIANIPFAKQVSMRVREIAIENAVFAFLIKAILIFLSIIGYCNLWFAIFMDMIAAVASILNTIRVTNESLISVIRYKLGR